MPLPKSLHFALILSWAICICKKKNVSHVGFGLGQLEGFHLPLSGLFGGSMSCGACSTIDTWHPVTFNVKYAAGLQDYME